MWLWLPTTECLMFSSLCYQRPSKPISLSFRKSWREWRRVQLGSLGPCINHSTSKSGAVQGRGLLWVGTSKTEIGDRSWKCIIKWGWWSQKKQGAWAILQIINTSFECHLYFLINFGALLPVSTGHLSPRNFLYRLLTLSPNNARVWEVLMSAEEEKIQAR